MEPRSHAPRGGLAREDLAALIEEGLTVRQMAARLDRSPTTVRYWIRAHGLAFTANRGRRPREIVDITEGGMLVALCPVHDETEHGVDGRGHLRCLRCRADAVVRRRRKVKEILVAEAGEAVRCVATTAT
jgi:helix-turn-helix protein